jgi:hypothetical protein
VYSVCPLETRDQTWHRWYMGPRSTAHDRTMSAAITSPTRDYLLVICRFAPASRTARGMLIDRIDQTTEQTSDSACVPQLAL